MRNLAFIAVFCVSSPLLADTVIHELDWHYKGSSPVGGKASPNANQGSGQFDTSWLTMTYEDLTGSDSDKVKLTIKANNIGWFPQDNPSMAVEKIWMNVDDNSALKNNLGGLSHTLLDEDGVNNPTMATSADGYNSSGAGSEFDVKLTFTPGTGDLDGTNFISIILDHSSLDLDATDFNENSHGNGSACYTAAKLKKKKNGYYYWTYIAADFTDVSTSGGGNPGGVIPEPGSFLIWGLGLGIAGVFAQRRRKKKAA